MGFLLSLTATGRRQYHAKALAQPMQLGLGRFLPLGRVGSAGGNDLKGSRIKGKVHRAVVPCYRIYLHPNLPADISPVMTESKVFTDEVQRNQCRPFQLAQNLNQERPGLGLLLSLRLLQSLVLPNKMTNTLGVLAGRLLEHSPASA